MSCCSYCSRKGHQTVNCDLFEVKTPKDRYDFVKERKLCINYLKAGHMLIFCKSSKTQLITSF